MILSSFLIILLKKYFVNQKMEKLHNKWGKIPFLFIKTSLIVILLSGLFVLMSTKYLSLTCAPNLTLEQCPNW